MASSIAAIAASEWASCRSTASTWKGATWPGPLTKALLFKADGNIVLDVQMQIPAGVVLVQGTAPQDLPHGRQISWTFPPAFGDGEPQMVEFAGPVTVMLKRIPDEYAALVKSGYSRETMARLGGFAIT
jgi:hypothetical protein